MIAKFVLLASAFITDAKRVKAMLALLEWFGNEGEPNREEEAAMIISAAKHQIPIP